MTVDNPQALTSAVLFGVAMEIRSTAKPSKYVAMARSAMASPEASGGRKLRTRMCAGLSGVAIEISGMKKGWMRAAEARNATESSEVIRGLLVK